MRSLIVAPDRSNVPDEAALARALDAARAHGIEAVCVLREGAIAERLGPIAGAADARIVPIDANAGFGAAMNAGIAVARGDAFVLLGSAEPLGPSWLDVPFAALVQTGAAIVGPRVVDPSGAGEQCGLFTDVDGSALAGFSLAAFGGVQQRMTCDAFVHDALALTRATFNLLDGFAETFGDTWEAIDFCLRAGERGGAVLVDPAWSVQRFAPAFNARARRLPFGEKAFAERWRGRLTTHENWWPERFGSIVRREYEQDGFYTRRIAMPPSLVIVHGAPSDLPAEAFLRRLRDSRAQPGEVWWAGDDAPPGTERIDDVGAAIARATEVRTDKYVAFVRRDTVLGRDWFNELVAAIERAPRTVAAAVGCAVPDAMAHTVDARCSLVRLSQIPQHLRLAADVDVDGAVAAWIAAVVNLGRSIVDVERSATAVGPPALAFTPALPPRPRDEAVFVSIVMLSWNAPEFTELAVASIRAHTRVPHEIIIVDNGSRPETVARLHRLEGIRLIENAVNTGFAFGCNQGLAAARGTHVVLLNNDVIVTDGWLEAMLEVQRRNPTIGCSGPVTNRIAGPQQIDVPYQSAVGAALFSAQRARERRGWRSDVARMIGFCLCLDRRVVDEVGGLDPRYATGNFEDDDFCIRIRAAGYDFAVCEDAFIHHFGSVSFKANNLIYQDVFAQNQAIFEERWDVRISDGGYDGNIARRRGFQRERDFVALPAAEPVGADWRRP